MKNEKLQLKDTITNKDFELLKYFAEIHNKEKFFELVNRINNTINYEEDEIIYNTFIEIIKGIYFDVEREYLIQEYCLQYQDFLDTSIFVYMVFQKFKKEIIPQILKRTISKSEKDVFEEWKPSLIEHIGIIKWGTLFNEESIYLSRYWFDYAFHYFFLFADLMIDAEREWAPNRIYTNEMFEYTSKLLFDGYKNYVAFRKTLEKFGLNIMKMESYGKMYKLYIKNKK